MYSRPYLTLDHALPAGLLAHLCLTCCYFTLPFRFTASSHNTVFPPCLALSLTTMMTLLDASQQTESILEAPARGGSIRDGGLAQQGYAPVRA